jgi:hypothetical protein
VVWHDETDEKNGEKVASRTSRTKEKNPRINLGRSNNDPTEKETRDEGKKGLCACALGCDAKQAHIVGQQTNPASSETFALRTREFKTAEATGLDLGTSSPTATSLEGGDTKKKEGEGEEGEGKAAQAAVTAAVPLTEAEAGELGKWLVETLPEKLMEVKPTTRLYDSPAIVTDHESGALRRMMRMVEQQSTGQASFVPKQHLEINPKHPIIVRLHALRTEDPDLARVVAEQMFDNAMVAAGLLDDSRVMLPRLNKLMERLVQAGKGGQ